MCERYCGIDQRRGKVTQYSEEGVKERRGGASSVLGGVAAAPSITSKGSHYFHQTTMTNSSHLQLPHGKRDTIYGASRAVSVLARPPAGAPGEEMTGQPLGYHRRR
ncbi:hypothetical protein E2C01_076747 [Portunus trituberculatus]|uniref:Uncharacterized protein n=1 Tax=Portunus trituberculatus TaxID=210409 RepID=A0A5B7IDZ9_PORTR|nr:hypothetical protein [Portunus trituberculatus]